ncbi:MAG: hypothetical protein MGF17_12900, partial [Trichodesmium sp. MAG_R04]|nr:hypothetical protein [Trichodesmium sp. MAG_R04]
MVSSSTCGQHITTAINYFHGNCPFYSCLFDSKAGFCPECGSYLSRSKINIKQPFYIECCMSCRGI